jgi:hypothetical protein
MRFYVTWSLGDDLAIIGEVVACPPFVFEGQDYGAPTDFAENLRSTCSGEIRTYAELDLTERGRAALDAWTRGDDQAFERDWRKDDPRYREEFRRERGDG